MEGAVRELDAKSPLHFGANNMGIRKALARRIRSAVEMGQRDPDRLRSLAVHVIEGREVD